MIQKLAQWQPMYCFFINHFCHFMHLSFVSNGLFINTFTHWKVLKKLWIASYVIFKKNFAVYLLYTCVCVCSYIFFIYEWCPASNSLTAWVIRTFYRKIKISWTCLCGALFCCPSVFFSRQLSIMFILFLNHSVLYIVRISLLLKKMFFTLFFSSTPNLVLLFFCFI